MNHSKAFVDTTVLTDALLKRDDDGNNARSALKRYSETALPVYAIKEFKYGPLEYYIWLHNKLLATKSLAMTLRAIADLIPFQKNRTRTANNAIADLLSSGVPRAMTDEEQADLLRGSIARLILASWAKRRKITSTVFGELSCYSEAEPKIEIRSGRFVNLDRICRLHAQGECCLAGDLKSRKADLDQLINAIKGREGREHTYRRSILHKLANTPKKMMEARDCARLGDAYFALYAPLDTVILTTNLKDHVPLASALGKSAISPSEALDNGVAN